MFGRLSVFVRDANVGVVFQKDPHAFNVAATGGQVHRSVATVGAAIDVVVPGSFEEVIQNLVMTAGDGFVERSVAEDSLSVREAVVQSRFVGKLDHEFDDFVQFARLAQFVEMCIVPHVIYCSADGTKLRRRFPVLLG